MKRLFSILLLSVILISCGSTTAPKHLSKKNQPDTIVTTIEYAHNWRYSDYRTVTAFKVIQDTFDIVAIDSITQKKKMVRDSFYFIQLLDTVRDEKGIVLDSMGKPKMAPQTYNVPRQYILKDFNRRWGK